MAVSIYFIKNINTENYFYNLIFGNEIKQNEAVCDYIYSIIRLLESFRIILSYPLIYNECCQTNLGFFCLIEKDIICFFNFVLKYDK